MSPVILSLYYSIQTNLNKAATEICCFCTEWYSWLHYFPSSVSPWFLNFVYNASTFDLPLYAFHFRSPICECNRTLVSILPPRGLSTRNSTIILSATLQTTSNLFLRQIAIPILLIPYYSSSEHLAQHPTWKDDTFKRVWWDAWLCSRASGRCDTDMMGPRAWERWLEALKKHNGNEWKRRRDLTTTSPIQQQRYMFAEEAPPDQHQPLLRTLTIIGKGFFKLRMTRRGT